MGVSILVTGGTGFLGSLIVTALHEKHPDWHITILDLQPPPSQQTPNLNINYVEGDVTKAQDILQTVQSIAPTVIVHTAGLVPPLRNRFSRTLEARVLDINVNGTANMLAAARQTRSVTAFVWTGSCTAVIDNFRHSYRNIDESYPTSAQDSLIYGESKAKAEKLVLAANDFDDDGDADVGGEQLATCALRLSVLFGPGDYQLIPSVHACIAKFETPFVIGNGTNLWDVSYAPNMADAHVLAVENLLSPTKTAAGEAIFIQNNEPIPFRDFCLEVWKNFGHYPPFEVRLPEGLAWLAGWVAELGTWAVGTPYTLSTGSVMDACAVRYASGEKARRLLGYEPRVGIEEGIRLSCAEYAQRLKANELEKQNSKEKEQLRRDRTQEDLSWRLWRFLE
ncbi:MAG: erg26, C-3 sterol dehydrogenase [Ramalina farinacea]|uniref:Erg26, C-3 sterol dehydrogenase n=1 Tax=Ramalina farinacea TaxID=258253 RepID=A0AA43U068_9LECA|nr:erg26, C-3 sterol dehydrogenase [Ramalina farinacea]